MRYDRNQYRTGQVDDYISMFYPELKSEFRDCRVLDVGCGHGVVSLSLAPRVRSVLGIDPSTQSIEKAKAEAELKGIKNARFLAMSAYDLDVAEKYDVVILSDVLEHVPDQPKLLQKCIEQIAPGGVLYVNTPNKWFPIEPHFNLPFLSWLPKSLANRYAQAFSGDGYQGYHLLSYRQFTNLLDSFQINYALKPQPNPQRMLYRVGNRIVTRAPFMWRFANAFQVIVQKR